MKTAISVRESSKADRRSRIVSAARALIRETGETGFSMRALAEAAEVSLVTPYNLFGSKQAIMLALLDADVAVYQTRLAHVRSADALETFFDAVSLARALYEEEPGFYRAVLLALYNSGGRELRVMFHGPRYSFWRGLVVKATQDGLLVPETDADAFTHHLAHVFASSLLDWVLEDISLVELDAQVQYGFALALLAMAPAASAARLKKRMLALQTRLTSLRKRPPEAKPAKRRASQGRNKTS